jgi:hypothetical protein
MSTPRSREGVIETVVERLNSIPPARLNGPPRWRQSAATNDNGGWRSFRRAGLATSIACAVSAGIAVAILFSSSSAVEQSDAALPVFQRPAVDASRTRALTPTLARNQAKYAHARQIETPNGAGYVMAAADGRICVAIPDVVDGYGQSCASRDQVERRGLAVSLTSNRGGVMAAVLPKTASDAALHEANGSTRTLEIIDGTITASAVGRASVSYRIGERRVSVRLFADLRCVHAPTSPEVDERQFDQAAKEAGILVCADDPANNG